MRSGGRSHKSSLVNDLLKPFHAKLVNQENARSDGKLAESFGHCCSMGPQVVPISEDGERYFGIGSAQNCTMKLVKAQAIVMQYVVKRLK